MSVGIAMWPVTKSSNKEILFENFAKTISIINLKYKLIFTSILIFYFLISFKIIIKFTTANIGTTIVGARTIGNSKIRATPGLS